MENCAVTSIKFDIISIVLMCSGWPKKVFSKEEEKLTKMRVARVKSISHNR